MSPRRYAALSLVALGCLFGIAPPARSQPAPQASALPAPGAAATPAPASRVYWQERFDGTPLRWIAPFDESAEQVAKVYSVAHEGPFSFLHAHHDGSARGAPKATHWGMKFDNPPPLDRIQALTWRWRVTRHPTVTDDPWKDLSASLYVLVRRPSLFKDGKGWKFGWLAKPGPKGTDQKGLLQVELRHDPAGPEWRSERVDLCASYRTTFGPCEGERVLYVGVLTDGDGTKSLAEGAYADFALEAK